MALSARTRRALLREWNGTRAVAVLLVASAMTGVSACGVSEPSDKPSATPTTSGSATEAPTPTPSDSVDQTKTQLIHIYDNYWAQMEKAYALGSAKETDLSKYAAGLALVKAEKNIANHSKAGRSTTGTVRISSSTVTKSDLSSKVPSATLTSCLDVSEWDLIDRKTKKKVALPEGRRTQYVIVSTFERWPEGWRVIKDEPQDQAC
ncbi:hypothetical protein [Streptomyces sp. NPDC056527]|uniref:hypothetical protein n=1 Tax=Streptomyces sp. NPDC056527 TaxID=3345853 RepID=UPI0036ADEA6B